MKYLLFPLSIIFFFLLFTVPVNALTLEELPPLPYNRGDTITESSNMVANHMLIWLDDSGGAGLCYFQPTLTQNQLIRRGTFTGYNSSSGISKIISDSYDFNCDSIWSHYPAYGNEWRKGLPYAPYNNPSANLKEGTLLSDVIYSTIPVYSISENEYWPFMSWNTYLTQNETRYNTDLDTCTGYNAFCQLNMIDVQENFFGYNSPPPIDYTKDYRLIYYYYHNDTNFPILVLSDNPCKVDDNEIDYLEIDTSTCGDITYAKIDNENLEVVEENNIDLTKSFQYWHDFITNPVAVPPIIYSDTEDKCNKLVDSNYILYDNSNNPICTSLSNPYLDEIFPPFTRLQFEQLDIEAIETEFKTGSFDFLWVAVEPVLKFLNLAIDFFNSIMDILVTGYRFIANLLLPNVLDIGFQIDVFRNYMMNDLLLVQNAFVFTNMVSEIFDITTSDVPDPITFNFRGDTMTILDLSNFNWNLLVTIRILTGISYFIAIAFVIRSMVIQILGRYTTLNIRDIPIKID